MFPHFEISSWGKGKWYFYDYLLNLQIRFINPKLCNKLGTTKVVADITQYNQTDFVVSWSTFSSLEIADKGFHIIKGGIIDIKYKIYTNNLNQYNTLELDGKPRPLWLYKIQHFYTIMKKLYSIFTFIL